MNDLEIIAVGNFSVGSFIPNPCFTSPKTFLFKMFSVFLKSIRYTCSIIVSAIYKHNIK